MARANRQSYVVLQCNASTPPCMLQLPFSLHCYAFGLRCSYAIQGPCSAVFFEGIEAWLFVHMAYFALSAARCPYLQTSCLPMKSTTPGLA